METVKRELDCAKETTELGEGLTKFVQKIKEALSDGWQPGQDLPVILTSSITDLVPAVQGVEKISDEAGMNEAFMNGLYVGLRGIPLAFVKKAE